MLFAIKPAHHVITGFIEQQLHKPFSYSEVGSSRDVPPPGYTVDHYLIRLGNGQSVYEAASAALRHWEMFNIGWLQLCWPGASISPGSTVAVLARCFGVWSLNACRIVYVFDESGPIRRFGFAYGTLVDHAERGEERFMVECRADNSVWYEVLAFSKPNRWLVRLGYPLARRLQKRFGADSLAAMAGATQRLVAAASDGSRG